MLGLPDDINLLLSPVPRIFQVLNRREKATERHQRKNVVCRLHDEQDLLGKQEVPILVMHIESLSHTADRNYARFRAAVLALGTAVGL